MPALPYALQLYTVREPLDRDVPGTLAQIKAAGYDFVETAGTHGLAPAAFREQLEAAGLTPISAHIGYEQSAVDPAAAAAEAQALGVPYVVVPWLGTEVCPDLAAWRAAAAKLDEAGAVFRDHGLLLCYHNHDDEFIPVEGTRPYDILLGETKPEHLAAEVDTYWVTYAGADPVALIASLAGRCPLLHIKDMEAGDDRFFAPVGRGIIDWAPIFAAGIAAGAEWFIAEQDETRGDPIESVAISAAYLANARVAGDA